jgi:hypothetical protein
MSRHFLVCLLSLLGLVGCTFSSDPATYVYQCETEPEAAFDYQPWGTVRCGENDPMLAGVEPMLPTEDEVCATLVSN